MKIKSIFTTLFSIFFILTASNSFAQITLKASHQFPGGKGDARDEMMNLLAKEVEKANVGVKIQVYPGQSLYKAMEQYKPLVEGQLDLVSLPLDYAAGFVPEFSITLMPGLVKNHEHAQRINASPFMKDIKKMINDQGAIVLADAWFAGGFASKKTCVTNPDSMKGQVTRAAGPMFEEMLVGAGASISSMASSEVYQGLQTGVLNAVNTSSQSFVSFKLFEQVKCITPPGKYALWFMYQPVLMSKKSFDKLNPKQKEAILAAGKKAEQYITKESAKLDSEMEKVFKEKGVQIHQMTEADFNAWIALAKKTSYKKFAEKVKGGDQLIAKALAVK
ncbi:TRAP transporter substrate-binding protein DctP [Candidatus Fonsibacter ubiquis]|uniref:TRAP transporter substrate-binding protein DctP n=1 Tax=Candidatus Fonsibacter ubiquis TaxID=1925548 RepID=UPI000C071FF2|nr:TRAP transporter substrate-binding protein DctP [Candidatus Fonsibacter ubiquis]